jgi:hypothetical protein
MGKPLFMPKQFIDAIPGTGGIITSIARKVGCDWHTANKYIKEHPTVQQAYANECETVLDVAELELIKCVRGGDMAAIRFYLSTKGKGRGYVERQEVSGPDNRPIAVKVLNGVTLDDL